MTSKKTQSALPCNQKNKSGMIGSSSGGACHHSFFECGRIIKLLLNRDKIEQ